MLQSIQRLNREVEVLQREREDLQQALSEAKCKQPEPQVHTDADYKYLESKLKVRIQGGFNYCSHLQSYHFWSCHVDYIRALIGDDALRESVEALSAHTDSSIVMRDRPRNSTASLKAIFDKIKT